MYLVEQHIIKRNHPFYKECDELCFKSKNLYNSGLYAVRKHFFEEKKFKTGFALISEFTKEDQFDYRQLPIKTSGQTLLLVEQNFKSFFSSLKSKRNGTNDRKVSIPNYLDKVKGRQVATFVDKSLSKKEFKKTGMLKLSMTNIFVKTQIKDFSSIKLVRIIPKNHHYVIEVCYTKVEKELKDNNGRYASIDLGLNNLATVSSNVVKPIIINIITKN